MIHQKKRCEWATGSLNITYHDLEWGVPVHDDTKLFEFLILEGAQAGLSWTTILKKRENYRKAFDSFNFNKIAQYNLKKITSLLANKGIIRNKLKIAATIQNAKAFLSVQNEFGTFDKYIWQFVGNKTIKSTFNKLSDYPAKTKEAETMSKDLLKKRVQICWSYDLLFFYASCRYRK